MTLSRRTVLTATATAAATALAGAATLATPSRVRASTPDRTDGEIGATANAAHYRFNVGDIRATLVSDGQIGFPALPAYAPGVAEGAVHGAMARHHLAPPTYRLDANVLLLETEARTILVDTGWGGGVGPTVGGLSGTLARLGIAADAIDTVVLTHIHPDHVGGLFGADGALALASARVVVTAEEIAGWRGSDPFGAMDVDAALRPLFHAAAQNVTSLGDRLDTVAMDAEIAPGVTLVPLPGHTPGHAGVAVRSHSETLLFAADAIHDPAFDVEHPSWRTAFDHDPARAEATRRAVLAQAVAERTLVAATHMPFPGLGHLNAEGEAFRWVPERWRTA